MTPLFDEDEIHQFIGFLSAEIPELHDVEIPRLAEAWEAFKREIGR